MQKIFSSWASFTHLFTLKKAIQTERKRYKKEIRTMEKGMYHEAQF